MGVAQSSRSTTRDAVIRATTAAKTPLQHPSMRPREDQQAVDGELQQQFSQNLKKIGQVNVDSTATLQRSLQMTHIVRTRAQSETDTLSQTGTTIDALGLSQLLDARKDAQTTATAQQLAQRYKLDAAVIERLAARYNTPSIGRENTLNLPDGDRRTYREAIWVNS